MNRFLYRLAFLAVFWVGKLPCAHTQDSLKYLLDTLPLLRPVSPLYADTASLNYVLPDGTEDRYPFADTLPDAAFRFYDPARQQFIDYATLGNLGTAARPLWHQWRGIQGFHTGFRVFELYQIRPEELRFFRHARTVSDVYFSQGNTQNDNMVRARLSRTFAGGLTFSLDYRSFNNQGQYRYQVARHNSLSLGAWYPIRKNYQVYAIYTRNANRQQDNGGIVSDTIFGSGQFGGPINAEVRLPGSTAFTRHADWTFFWMQDLHVSNARSREFRLQHRLKAGREQFKFYNQSLAQDSVFFDTFLVDRRGLRHFIDLYRVENSVDILTNRNKAGEGSNSDLLAAGISHTYFRVAQEPVDTTISNLFLTGRLAFDLGKRIALKSHASLGLLDNIGEYQISGVLNLNLGKAGILDVRLQSQRRPPALIDHRLYVSQRLVWENQFEKPVESNLSATYALPDMGLSLGFATHLINHYIYYDQIGYARQAGSALQVAQFFGSWNFRLWNFRFDNTAGIQRSNRSDIWRLPEWFAKNSAYFSGKIFRKRLDLRLGADFRINSRFQPDAYQPLHWQFHLQDGLWQEPYPWIDLFAAFRVSSFRFFFRYENLQALWDKRLVFYQTAFHPLPFNGFRLGFSWRFLDENTAAAPSR